MSALGHRIYDSVVPGLSSKIPATSLEKDALFFDNILTNDGKALSSSLDTFMTKEEGIKYALDVASASKAVELSKSSPYSFLDQRQLDLVQAASSALNVFYSVTPESRKVIQEASKVAAYNPTPFQSQDKKVWINSWTMLVRGI